MAVLYGLAFGCRADSALLSFVTSMYRGFFLTDLEGPKKAP